MTEENEDTIDKEVLSPKIPTPSAEPPLRESLIKQNIGTKT